jgi:hypothetical protein
MTPKRPSPKTIASFLARLTVVALLLFFALGVLGPSGAGLGCLAARISFPVRLVPFGFVGNFIFVLSDFVRLVGPPFIILDWRTGSASFGSRYGQEAIMKTSGLSLAAGGGCAGLFWRGCANLWYRRRAELALPV